MSSLEHHIRTLAEGGVQITLWPTERGYQANVKEKAGSGWICVTNDDPIWAVTEALRQRVTAKPTRHVVAEPTQVDIEEAIAAAPPPAAEDDFADLIG